jgi:ABC-2 type transport system ATP-binding protein
MKILCGVWEADPAPRTDTLAVGARTENQERITVPARIGYLPEQNPLYEDMYIAEYLQFMANISVIGYRFSVIGKDEIEDLIRRVGLTPERNKHIRELSKGYKQRVGLAQALMGQPELLVLDEPTTGLDPNQLTEIRALIRQEASEKRTILLSTHILQEVEALCDRVIIIDHGEIKADLRMEEIEDLEKLFRQKTTEI